MKGVTLLLAFSILFRDGEMRNAFKSLNGVKNISGAKMKKIGNQITNAIDTAGSAVEVYNILRGQENLPQQYRRKHWLLLLNIHRSSHPGPLCQHQMRMSFKTTTKNTLKISWSLNKRYESKTLKI